MSSLLAFAFSLLHGATIGLILSLVALPTPWLVARALGRGFGGAKQ